MNEPPNRSKVEFCEFLNEGRKKKSHDHHRVKTHANLIPFIKENKNGSFAAGRIKVVQSLLQYQ
jgi:hypothetical protein